MRLSTVPYFDPTLPLPPPPAAPLPAAPLPAALLPPPPPLPAAPLPPPPPPPAARDVEYRLHPSLEKLGNAKGWRRVLDHLKRQPHVPLVLWGPTGCGKSEGLRLLLKVCRFHSVTLDGADGEDNAQLLRTICATRAINRNTEGYKTAVVLEDVEGFTDQTRRAVAAMCRTPDTRLAPLLLTATELRAPPLRDVVAVPHADVRLFAPSNHTLRVWFETHHPWTVIRSDGTTFDRKGFPPSHVSAVDHLLLGGDVRQVALALRWNATRRLAPLPPPTITTQADRPPPNAFEAARRLLRANPTSDGAWRTWANHAEERDVDLLQAHLPTFATSLDALAYGLDALSFVRSVEPSRYETHSLQVKFSLAAAGLATQLTTHARDVGALAPPARIRCAPDSRKGTYEIPACLREGGARPRDRA